MQILAGKLYNQFMYVFHGVILGYRTMLESQCSLAIRVGIDIDTNIRIVSSI